MVALQQSGSITPGHLAVWTTDGVLQDGGVVQSSNTILAKLLSADFNSILDQPLQIPKAITAFQFTGLLVTNASLSLTTAVGGVYPATAKGGTAIVAASQTYSALTTANKLLSLTLAAGVSTTRYSSANLAVLNGYLMLYLSLTTAQGANAVADIYLLGNNLSV